MELFTQVYKLIVSILVAIYNMFFPESEGFISLSGLKSGDLSLYPNTGVNSDKSSRGGDDRYRMFEPYLRQTELSSYEQRDNHKWPIGRSLSGSTEQTLSSAPVLPCDYPRPENGGEQIHTRQDALCRNKLMHASFI